MKIRGQRVIPPEERLASMATLEPVSGCWEWTGTVRSKDRPYGRMTIGSRSDGSRRTIGAHRYSYLVFKGDIPDDMCVCHQCDNPRCVNPDHLFLGTKKDNADDRDRKGRNIKAPTRRGSNASGAKLTDAQVAEIRASELPSVRLAPLYNVCDSHIRALRRGECFADLSLLPPAPKASP